MATLQQRIENSRRNANTPQSPNDPPRYSGVASPDDAQRNGYSRTPSADRELLRQLSETPDFPPNPNANNQQSQYQNSPSVRNDPTPQQVASRRSNRSNQGYQPSPYENAPRRTNKPPTPYDDPTPTPSPQPRRDRNKTVAPKSPSVRPPSNASTEGQSRYESRMSSRNSNGHVDNDHFQDNWQAGKTLPQTNLYMLNNDVATDVMFLVGESKEKIRAHKYMLISRSQQLYKMFKHQVGDQVVLKVPDVKPVVFREMLVYIYTDEMIITAENSTPLLYAAKKFGLKSLSDACFQFFDSEMYSENVCKVMEQAHIYDETGLYEKCYRFILANANDVLKAPSFSELCPDCVMKIIQSDNLRADEVFVYEAMMTWANSECSRKKLRQDDKNRREVLGKLLYLIRFPVMDVSYFTHQVSLGNILTKEEKLSIFQYFHGEEQRLPNKFKKEERNRIPRSFDAPNPFIDRRIAEPAISTPKGPGIDNMSRVLRFETTNGHWKHNGPPDAICFMVSQPIILYGAGIYGPMTGSETYHVTISVYDDFKEEIRRTETSIYTNVVKPTYDILLSRPLRVPANRTFTVGMTIKGSPAIRGVDGLITKMGEGVMFTFSNSNRSSNGTDTSSGQIPFLLFGKTQ